MGKSQDAPLLAVGYLHMRKAVIRGFASRNIRLGEISPNRF